ncbi:glycosyltransferase family 25 protein [Chaetomium strumarium]|uniref:Glycosyltransferase family 25 protein n=1 Tax=Chaetomium strumarium TaxID=1170767 RepID=A0AAJ0M187_9PEZI|nr:glycosyltransferase family 25 protein [Chaetomium strumarium]
MTHMTPRRRNVALFLELVVALLLWSRESEWLLVLPRWSSDIAQSGHPDIQNRTLGFQHIFAINLPPRTDRRDAMTIAASLSNLNVTWIDGIAGNDVLDEVLPGNSESRQSGFTVGNKGSWRAHMNVLQRIVHENITSALILEDDADWDVRLKRQLQVFARAARAFTQPTSRHGQTLARERERHHNTARPEVHINQLPRRITHHHHQAGPSPYGTDWDVLWLGHCGTEFPSTISRSNNSKTPPNNQLSPPSLLRVTIPNDKTVPSPHHLKPHPFALPDALASQYPPHTRVVHASHGTVCTQAYAVSQQGARRLLWRFGLQTVMAGWDLMLRDWCDGLLYSTTTTTMTGDATGAGVDEEEEEEKENEWRRRKGRGRGPVCVTVQPPLFSHHYGPGAASDIMAPGGGFVNREREMTPYVRVSVRLNMERLVDGREGVEQWDDGG